MVRLQVKAEMCWRCFSSPPKLSTRALRQSILCLTVAIYGCASAPTPAADGGKAVTALRQNFSAQMRACTEKTAYVPLDDSERRLAPNELAYRQCIYQGVEAVVLPAIPFDSVRQSYVQLIAEDKRLTDEVAAGRMTRGDRQAQLDAMKQAIKSKYAALVEVTIEHQRQDDMERTRANVQQQRELWQIQQQINDVHTSIMPAFR
jgi:hypothetical protein